MKILLEWIISRFEQVEQEIYEFNEFILNEKKVIYDKNTLIQLKFNRIEIISDK